MKDTIQYKGFDIGWIDEPDSRLKERREFVDRFLNEPKEWREGKTIRMGAFYYAFLYVVDETTGRQCGLPSFLMNS